MKQLQVKTAARKLKVTMLLDPAPFAAVERIPDQAPARTQLTVEVGGRIVHADIATRALRRAVAAIWEHGPDGIALTLQGVLTAAGAIEDAGLSAQPKTPAATATASVSQAA